MAEYSISSVYNEAEAKEYSLKDFRKYIKEIEIEKKDAREAKGNPITPLEDHTVRTAEASCRKLLEHYGHIPRELSQMSDYERFSYFQLVGFLFELVSSVRDEERMDMSDREEEPVNDNPCGKEPRQSHRITHTKSIVKRFTSPSPQYDAWYDKILRKFDKELSKAGLGFDVVQSYEKDIYLAQDYIHIISQSLFFIYGDSPAAVETLQTSLQHYHDLLQSSTDIREKDVSKDRSINYLHIFYEIVASAKVLAWCNELQIAFEIVRTFCSSKETPTEKFAKMVQPTYRKVKEEDKVLLAYNRDEKSIVEAMSDRKDLLYEKLVPREYSEAIGRYIDAHIAELAQKVFCEDKPSKGQKERIQNHKDKIISYIHFEFARYKNNNPISKAKLISIYQAYFLALPRAKYGPKKEGAVKSQGGSRENSSYSSSFVETSLFKNSFHHQVLCVWIDYQNIINSAPIQKAQDYANYYLDVNISALEYIFKSAKGSSVSKTVSRAKETLDIAVKNLIPLEDGRQEIESLCQRFWAMTGFQLKKSPSFQKWSDQENLGAFLRLYSLEEVMRLITQNPEKLNSAFMLNLDFAGQFSTGEAQNICFGIAWNLNEHCYQLLPCKSDALQQFLSS